MEEERLAALEPGITSQGRVHVAATETRLGGYGYI
jgi:hypothetical protein